MNSGHVLVTGAAGYLGSVLCERLLAAGYRVTALDNLMHRQNSLLHLACNPRFEFVLGDVRDEGLLRDLVKPADVIIPLAAIVGAPACDRDPELASSVNLHAVRLLNRLREPRQLVVFPTTNCGYGARSSERHCTEETPLEPISLYGRTKAEAERALLDSPNTISLRLTNVFGMSPRLRLDLLVNHFVHKAVSDRHLVIFEKDFRRNYVHIGDVADCCIHAIENNRQMAGRAYNVGLDEDLSKEELARRIQSHVPDFSFSFAPIASDPDKRDFIVSNQRLHDAGFWPKRSLDDGIRELIKGYRMMPAQFPHRLKLVGGPSSSPKAGTQRQVPHLESSVGVLERDAVARVVESGWISEGKEAAAFVAELQALTGAPYAVLAPNGTLALAMALLALNIGPGDEVIVPASTFVGSATAVTLVGATPVFCEVEPLYYQMAVRYVDRVLTRRTRAIMPVHLYGATCAMEELVPYAQDHQLHVVEDAAQTIGIRRSGRHAGTFGIVAGMSFFADKSVTTGEGGLVMTSDARVYQRLREIRNQGRTDRGHYIHPTIGYNFRMTDVQAAMGRVQLVRLPETKAQKLRVYTAYQEGLMGLPVALLKADAATDFTPHRSVVTFDDARRAEVFLRERGVDTRTTFMPMPHQPCFAHLPSAGQPFPNAQALYDRALMLPCYPTLSDEAVAYVCAQVRAYCEQGR